MLFRFLFCSEQVVEIKLGYFTVFLLYQWKWGFCVFQKYYHTPSLLIILFFEIDKITKGTPKSDQSKTQRDERQRWNKREQSQNFSFNDKAKQTVWRLSSAPLSDPPPRKIKSVRKVVSVNFSGGSNVAKGYRNGHSICASHGRKCSLFYRIFKRPRGFTALMEVHDNPGPAGPLAY